MPKTAAEWATFVVNEDLLQIYAFAQAKTRGLNKQTISKPVSQSSIFDNESSDEISGFFLASIILLSGYVRWSST